MSNNFHFNRIDLGRTKWRFIRRPEKNIEKRRLSVTLEFHWYFVFAPVFKLVLKRH